jgi:hypothetical protein
MTICSTADTHFEEQQKGRQKFSSLSANALDELIEQRWRVRIAAGNTVWHLGDVGKDCQRLAACRALSTRSLAIATRSQKRWEAARSSHRSGRRIDWHCRTAGRCTLCTLRNRRSPSPRERGGPWTAPSSIAATGALIGFHGSHRRGAGEPRGASPPRQLACRGGPGEVEPPIIVRLPHMRQICLPMPDRLGKAGIAALRVPRE